MLKNYALFIAVAYTLALAVMSLVNLNSMPVEVKSNDKFLHVIAYFLLTLFWLLALVPTKNLSRTVAITIGCIIYGTILEVIQGELATQRMSDVFDIIANSIGAVIATTLFVVIKRRLR